MRAKKTYAISFFCVLCVIVINLYSVNSERTDIANIELSGVKLLCKYGFSPRWSPDGKKILYTAMKGRNFEIWQMNSDGSNKEFITNGLYGFWSPDGNRVAYLDVFGYTLNIYDLGQNKVLYKDSRKNALGAFYQDLNMETFSFNELYWHSSGNLIVWASLASALLYESERWRLWIFNIDSLKWRNSSNRKESDLYNSIIRNNKHENFNIKVIPPYVPKNHALDTYLQEKLVDRYSSKKYSPLYGIWVTSRDESNCIRLLENAFQPELSPSLDKLVYVKLGAGGDVWSSAIYSADIKNTGSNLKSYIVGLGKKNRIEIGDYFIIAEPKINPLTDKIIGYSEPIKAIARAKAVNDSDCVVQIEVLIQRFASGDLAVCEKTGGFGLIKNEYSKSELLREKKEVILLLNESFAEFNRVVNVFGDIKKSFILIEEYNDVLRKIQQFAWDNQVKIEKFSPKQSSNKEFYDEKRISIEMTGSQNGFENLFFDLDEFSRLIIVEELSVTPTGIQKGKNQFSVSCIVKTYVTHDTYSSLIGFINKFKKLELESLSIESLNNNNVGLKKWIDFLSKIIAEKDSNLEKFKKSVSEK